MAEEQNRAEAAETQETNNKPAPEAEKETDQVAVLEGQVAELRDRFLRAVAEGENIRKRAEKDVAEARAYGITAFARDVLTVADNLGRTIEHVSAEARASADPSLKSLLEGVEITERDLQMILQKNGVKPINPMGEKFDPHFHQAMFEVPDSGRPHGTVVQVVQTGYAIGDRVLRPAMVGVAKGAAKAPKEASEAK
ncbi:MAG TPA: nucleotide exchange factor GrpE [Xanthobacteraceae bacterium]|nr:nucleotide exchange factor GrpE [Xanthobacteraceae bacterium]